MGEPRVSPIARRLGAVDALWGKESEGIKENILTKREAASGRKNHLRT